MSSARLRAPWARPLLVLAALALTPACAAVQGATKAGMKPILTNGIDGFLTEPDPVVAEGAIVANMKLIEGVVATYPDDVELLNMAAMARANYAFGFVQDQLEALRLAHPEQRDEALVLQDRVLMSYAAGRAFAERALMENGGFASVVGDRGLEALSVEELQAALAELSKEDAPAVFWLAFNWGGSMQTNLDPAEATQLPKVELLTTTALALDPSVFYDIGPHMLAGALYGFRSPALGGDPKKAIEHLDEAKARGNVMLPDVLKAQFVYAQTEQEEAFKTTLEAVIAAKPRPDRALLDTLAQIKACRLLANIDGFFLTDAQPVPARCHRLPHRYRLRAEPLPEPEPES